MFGIDLRPLLSSLLNGVDLSGVPQELAPAVVLAVLVMIGIKWADKKYLGQALKGFYGAITFVVSLLAGALGVILNGGNPLAVIGTVFGVYPLAVTVWAAYEAVRNAKRAVTG